MSALIGKTLLLLSILTAVLASLPVQAQFDNELEAVRRPVLWHPPSQVYGDDEAFVLVHFMVDSEGYVIEPSVYRSTGHPDFQKEALKAVASSRWKPLERDGVPTLTAAFFLARFVDRHEEPSVNFAFRRRYDAVIAAIAENDQQSAKKLFDELEAYSISTNFEHILLNLTRFSYFRKYGGDELQLMQYLDAALFFESSFRSRRTIEIGAESMPADVVALALRNLFMLQVNNRRYVEALRTYEFMQEAGQNVDEYDQVAERIRAVRQDESAYIINDVIPDSGSWHILVAKPGFFVQSANSDISELTLRCLHNSQTFAFEEGAEYRIPPSWGSCSLEIKGSPGSQIQLEQFG
ncbi:TonB family protein [Pseudohongiella sp. SYSU M77423]|uniref:energy transducer TonB n=1 Tax=Pseudohongiella sp. SYSU M77423 TaxID=3042312 RepID=UPI00247FA1CD|nr:TonB family protein [Pseudohongiella sp. SYSU M77423]MDH7943363.1 TonB family protein [Pseudohongiella sp. SYSU M77423]